MYKKLGIAIAINTVLMFLVAYTMIDTLDNFYLNINKAYMAIMMAAPMVIIMILVMRSMYKDEKLNFALIAVAVGVFLVVFLLTRTQTPVGDDQFLRSMIPHHSSAILMCQEADLRDQEIIDLCDQIVQSQQEEITQMKTILDRMP